MAESTSINVLEPVVMLPSGHQMARAIAWSAAGKWISQLFAWASTLIVVRLLSPGDFGLLGMAVTYLGLIELISEFGIGTAVVTLRTLTPRQVSQLHTAAVILGLVATALSFALAVPLSRFFHAPELSGLLFLMALGFVITGFKSVPYALLQKDLRFVAISRIDAAQALLQALASAFLVWMGLRFWAIAISGLAGAALSTYLLFRNRPVQLAPPAFRSVACSMAFSWRILVSRLSWYLYSNADFVVAGRILGKIALGAYTVAWNFANLPGEKIVTLITSVTPTFFASVQDDQPALRNYFASLTEILAVVMFPVVSGFALIAPLLVPLACGPHWRAAIMPMQLLAIYTFLRSITALLPQVINAVGETRFGMWNSLLTLAILPASFFIASRWGVLGIASVWVLIYPLLTVPLYRRTLKSIEMSFAQYLAALRPSLFGTAGMTIAVLITGWAVPNAVSSTLRLACEIAVGAAVYPAILVFAFPGNVNRYWRFAKRLRSAS
ncbi:MAG TPA: lipopolysaccharide biosynthesis protein [Bryobacteraceae bacterium]|jgi:PST family polysaccharide transporter|nr:lipopolysaccharide biosynthesis protein [Bryobacteraceae bacterium]